MSTEQFLVVGLDVVRRFADNLPNLSAFLDDGAVGHLQAVLPGPHSSAAWTSFSTGTNPGRHGIGDWRRKDGYDFRPVTGNDIARRGSGEPSQTLARRWACSTSR